MQGFMILWFFPGAGSFPKNGSFGKTLISMSENKTS
jgi:hypothetical protein